MVSFDTNMISVDVYFVKGRINVVLLISIWQKVEGKQAIRYNIINKLERGGAL